MSVSIEYMGVSSNEDPPVTMGFNTNMIIHDFDLGYPHCRTHSFQVAYNDNHFGVNNMKHRPGKKRGSYRGNADAWLDAYQAACQAACPQIGSTVPAASPRIQVLPIQIGDD